MFHSIVLQVVVEHRGTFTYISAGWLGSVPGAHMLRNSRLATLVESECFVLGLEDLQLGTIIALPLFIGDPVYLLLLWLMRPHNG